MSNSELVKVIGLSPFTNGKRRLNIDRITVHCIVGNFPAERLPQFFDDEGVSCNYAIAQDGSIALIVDESENTWCSSDENNDQRAVTIECSCDTISPYQFTNECYEACIDLCVDICRRNNMDHMIYIDDTKTAIQYDPPVGECQLTLHRMFANKACPGDWFVSQIPEFVHEVNWRLSGNTKPSVIEPTYFRVQIGAFRNTKYAENMANKANESGVLSEPADIFFNPSISLYVVQCGKFVSETEARNLAENLKKAGFTAFIKKG